MMNEKQINRICVIAGFLDVLLIIFAIGFSFKGMPPNILLALPIALIGMLVAVFNGIGFGFLLRKILMEEEDNGN